VCEARVVKALLIAGAIATSLVGCGGSGGQTSTGVDKGGFTQKQRDAAQTGLDTLQHMSVSAIVLQTTTSKGLPVCRIHLARKSPAIFDLLLVWIPKGQYATSATGNRYAWLRLRFKAQGPDLRSWQFRNAPDYATVKASYGNALSQPVEPCVILNSGSIKETRVSPHTAVQTATLLGRGLPPSLRQAPLFHLSRVDKSGELALQSLRGKTVLLDFWSTSCQGCAGQATRLQQVYEKWRSRGVVVVGVNEFDFATDVQSFIRRYGITYPVVHDPSGIGKRYAVDNLPETFFIDPRGRIVTKVAGVASVAQLEAKLRTALK
jgi:peroxiredoxin